MYCIYSIYSRITNCAYATMSKSNSMACVNNLFIFLKSLIASNFASKDEDNWQVVFC